MTRHPTGEACANCTAPVDLPIGWFCQHCHDDVFHVD